MMSSHMLTSFCFALLQHSVRSGGDARFCELQKNTRLMPHELSADVQARFKLLLAQSCTFVECISHELIPPTATFVFGKKKPGEQIQEEIISKRKQNNSFLQCIAKDEEMIIEGNWVDASNLTVSRLNQKMREPKILYLFQKALYLVTFNSPTKKNQPVPTSNPAGSAFTNPY